MYLRCYYCGHTMPLARGLDAFEGPLRCRVCRKEMTVRLESGYLRSMSPLTPEPGTDPRRAEADPNSERAAAPSTARLRRPNNSQVPTEAAA